MCGPFLAPLMRMIGDPTGNGPDFAANINEESLAHLLRCPVAKMILEKRARTRNNDEFRLFTSCRLNTDSRLSLSVLLVSHFKKSGQESFYKFMPIYKKWAVMSAKLRTAQLLSNGRGFSGPTS
jgi:hypothetical protein